jgi:zinc/manganese transport system substrate-binding protein
MTRADPPRAARHRSSRTVLVAAISVAASTCGLTACSSNQASAPTSPGVVQAVGAENEYANVLQQIGGKYVSVASILDNPNTDPHTFEASTSVAQEVAHASLIVQNGAGYDTFMNQIEAASPNAARKVIVAQNVMGLPDSTRNPHLWYDPKTMPAMAGAMAAALGDLAPDDRGYFQARLAAFDASLQPWLTAIATFRAQHASTPVAVTEPVADYLLQAMGANIVTPFPFQADIMNGVDPSPEAITHEEGLFTDHVAKVFCYNQQVVSSLTASIRQTAQSAGVPVVGVYETMPTPGYDYQAWMEAEVTAINAAIEHGTSTEHL